MNPMNPERKVIPLSLSTNTQAGKPPFLLTSSSTSSPSCQTTSETAKVAIVGMSRSGEGQQLHPRLVCCHLPLLGWCSFVRSPAGIIVAFQEPVGHSSVVCSSNLANLCFSFSLLSSVSRGSTGAKGGRTTSHRSSHSPPPSVSH